MCCLITHAFQDATKYSVVSVSSLQLGGAILGLLKEGGVPAEQAAWGVDLLFAYPTLLAAERGSRSVDQDAGDHELTGLASRIDQANSVVLPNLVAIGRDLVAGTPEQRLRWGLAVLVNGITHTVRA